jgi:spoIIIJ-associated protein
MENVKNIVEDVLKKGQIPFSGLETSEAAGQKIISIKADNPNSLIGTRGETIRAIDYIVKKIAEQKGVEDLYFLVDINDYRLKQIQDLQNKAKMMADRAKSFKYDVELTPMSSYERLIVHTTLADVDDVKTESHGDGRNRRVVIRYVVSQSI